MSGNSVPTKLCSKCCTEQPLGKGWNWNVCHACRNAAATATYHRHKQERLAKAREYYKANKEKVAARNAAWARKNAAKVRASHQKKYHENIDDRRRKSREWLANNADRKAKTDREYYQNNRGKVLVKIANQRARKRSAKGTFTEVQILDLLVAQKGRCANLACKVVLDMSKRRSVHRDHIMPLLLGGSNDIGNIQLLCQRCNCSKQAKTPGEWAKENGVLF